MKKIVNAIMDGEIVVGMDRDADKVIIPGYAIDTTYQMPLTGLKCVEINSLNLLGKFIGLPQKLILNDTSKFKTFPDPSETSVFSLLRRPGLKWLELTDKNEYFKTIDGILYTKDGEVLIKCPMGRTGDINIPDGTKVIEMSAFEDCHISSVVMPDSLINIEARAFNNCQKLEHVDFGHGITRIGSPCGGKIFYSCKKLKQIEIPKQIEYIGQECFWGCGLENLVLHNGLKQIDDNAFSFCENSKTVSLPDSLECIGTNNLRYMNKIYTNIIPSGFIRSIAPNITIGASEYSSEVGTVILHYDNTIICIPRGGISNEDCMKLE